MLAAANPAVITIMAIIFVALSLALIVFVLFRQSDSGGIGAAFGGGEGGGAFGTKGQAVVDKVITFMGGAFIIMALIFNLLSTQGGVSTEGIDQPAGNEAPADGGE